MLWTARIDGAISFADMKIEKGNCFFREEIDKDYKVAILTDKIFDGGKTLALMVSKDEKTFSLGMCVEMDGKTYTADDIGKMLIFKKPEGVKDGKEKA